MSQIDDMNAVNNYFNTTPARTPEALKHKQSWTPWFQSIGPLDIRYKGNVWDEARARRNAFNLANAVSAPERAKVENVINTGLISEELQGKNPSPAAVAAKRQELAAKVKEVNAKVTAEAAPIGTIRQGSSGPTVARWQTILGLKPVDGKFGPGTKAATITFQKSKALTADGVVGPKTWSAALGTATQPAAPPQAATVAQTISQIFQPAPTSKPAAKPPAVTVPAQPASQIRPPMPRPGQARPPAPAAPKPVSHVPPTVTTPSAVLASTQMTLTDGWSKMPTWAKLASVGLTIAGVVFGYKQIQEKR